MAVAVGVLIVIIILGFIAFVVVDNLQHEGSSCPAASCGGP
ncbi:hypothetical protein [Streptacidiphilus sp. EB129]